MVVRSFFTGLFVLTSLYLLLSYQFGMVLGAPGGTNNNQERQRTRSRVNRFSRPIQYSRLKNEPFISDFIVDDDDLFEMSKRQQSSDDYGHLRFGKREEFSDDYGHMRFGRNQEK